MKYVRTLPNGRVETISARELDDHAVKNRHLRLNAASAKMSGKFPRPPEACPRCGATSVVMDAHHPDYAKPYDVQWFCHPCHMRHHRDLRVAAAHELGFVVVMNTRERSELGMFYPEVATARVRLMEATAEGVA